MNASDSAKIIKTIIENQGFIALFSALLGAIVGSVTGYWFNTRLEKRRANERFWTQRKNTIYSPLYKELLSLKEYLTGIFNSTEPFINIEFESIERSYSFTFSIWELIKKDIRYDYIPDDLKKLLNDLTENLLKQISLQETIITKIKSICEDFCNKNNNIFDEVKTKNTDMPGSLYHSVYGELFPRRISERKPIDDFMNNYIKETYKKDTGRLSGNLRRKIRNTLEYKSLRKDLKKLVNTVTRAIEGFRSLIVKIISSTEGGVNYD